MSTITRRTLAKGVAWSAPVIMASASVPAYAASQCVPTPVTFDWSKYTRDQPVVAGGLAYTSGTVLGATSVGTVSLKVTHTANSAVLSGSQDLQGALSGNQPGASYSGTSPYMMIQTITNTTPHESVVTFTFEKPVTGLTFTIGDIDTAAGNWKDILTPTPGYVVKSNGAAVTESAGSFTGTGNQTPSSTAGNVTLTYPGELSTLTIKWTNGGLKGSQNIIFSSFAGTVCRY